MQLWNRQSEERWGLRADEIRGQHLLNLDMGLPVLKLRQPLRDCLAGSTARALPGAGTFGIVIRGRSGWATFSGPSFPETGACWAGPIPVSELDAADGPEDYALPHESESWRLRYGTPQPRPDGTTTISWRRYFSRGVARVDADGRIREANFVERSDPTMALWAHATFAYPARIAQIAPTPTC